MDQSRYAAPHEQDPLTLPRPFRLVSNALIGLCLLLTLLTVISPVLTNSVLGGALLDSAARKPVAAAACSGCIQPSPLRGQPAPFQVPRPSLIP